MVVQYENNQVKNWVIFSHHSLSVVLGLKLTPTGFDLSWMQGFIWAFYLGGGSYYCRSQALWLTPPSSWMFFSLICHGLQGFLLVWKVRVVILVCFGCSFYGRLRPLWRHHEWCWSRSSWDVGYSYGIGKFKSRPFLPFQRVEKDGYSEINRWDIIQDWVEHVRFFEDVLDKASLDEGDIFVLGLSSSEVGGQHNEIPV